METVVLTLVNDTDRQAVDDDIKMLIMPVLKKVAERESMSFHVTVMLAENEVIKDLNRQFRGVDQVTDVLSFPAVQFSGMLVDYIASGGDVERTEGVIDLGDIAVCMDRVAKQAEELGHPVEREMVFLTLHGVLHLMGYDHDTEEDEEVMTAAQRQIMSSLGYGRSGS